MNSDDAPASPFSNCAMTEAKDTDQFADQLAGRIFFTSSSGGSASLPST
jgi:hypothetical protein